MEGSYKEKQNKKKLNDQKTFTVPYQLVRNQENVTNTINKLSKEKIINQAIKFHLEGNIQEASEYYQYCLNEGIHSPLIFSNYGSILKSQGNLKEAELFQRKAIELNPYFANAHSNLGNILSDLGKSKEAEISYRQAIYLNPNFANAYHNLGYILSAGGNYSEAIKSYETAIKLNTSLSASKADLMITKRDICDWSNQERDQNWLKNLGIKGKSVIPWNFFFLEDNPKKHLQRAKKYYKENFLPSSDTLASFRNKKIHIGYFSADFKEHATMYLIASLIELHDKSKFQIYLYSFTTKEDNYTERAKSSGCIFRNIKDLSTTETIQLARNDKLDIAIDLKGYTKDSRMNIFSQKVAPIQVNYLGYPGSLGAETINYLIADDIVIPKEYEKYYSENIIRMSSCYQCNDNKKEISKEKIKRTDFNLPEKGFVFTCFNSSRKISPNEFEIWMRLLKEIKGSVIWLYKSNTWATKNLYKEAEIRNIDPKRLIFAEKLPLKKHLARYTLGDLGLDTFNCNGHTTTSDALWAGLPVLTKIGESFAARVSASILNSAGLPELITSSEKEYEEKALYIAKNPNQLIGLKSKLAKSKKKSPLYNSELFTKELEKKFKEICN
tara:strand:+ start:3598 stop:5430 length:1833 start_codon:yes stop_codon:yes gene_type:complete